MKIGLIGSGGREHAMARAFCRQSTRDSIFVFGSHKNPGIDLLAAETVVGMLGDVPAIVEYFAAKKVDYVAVGPEVSLDGGRCGRIAVSGHTDSWCKSGAGSN